MILPYDASKEERDRIVKERQAKTAAAFDRMREMIDEQTATMNMSTVSEKVRRQQLEEIRNELQKSLGTFYSDLEIGLKSDMESIGQSVLNESKGFYEALNMPIAMSITSFPVEVMTNIVNGSVYEEKWYLSQALWGDYTDKLDDINEVITQGIGLNLSTYEIAKNLEKYVDPSARKDWAWSKVYPGTAKTVDYNAQRLARTLIAHAYQQNVVRQAQANPFATGVKWEASGGERMCEICEERDGKIFPVDDVPLDHPNGMCTFSVQTPSMMEMSNTLADWVNGEPTDWDDQLNAYYEGMPIEHKSTANASSKESKTQSDKIKEGIELYRKFVEGGAANIHELAGYDWRDWGNYDASKVNKEKLEAIDSVFEPVGKELHVYKGVSMSESDIERLINKKEEVNHSYSSTSLSKVVANDYASRAFDIDAEGVYPVVMDITVEDDVPVASAIDLLGSGGMKSFEKEITIGRETVWEYSNWKKHDDDGDEWISVKVRIRKK